MRATSMVAASVLCLSLALGKPQIVLAEVAVRADTSATATAARAAGAVAPTRPLLLYGATGAGADGGEDAAGIGSSGETDPLVSNGLGSPSCRDAIVAELSATDRSHCETSGFVAAPAPTGDYGIDIHIDTGLLGLSTASLYGAVQDLLITPLWMALVWAVHALIVIVVKLDL